ncbi:MAG: phosphoribosylglycinamide formyltransferase [Deltaproteobacteria bacterium]|jgi:phosphoribosylglycinamide formyltransferase 1|nr:phosphoribosylglycinamide formyltransferase [Deltaproteobacteria bacterium]MBT6431816.1 phosphoribosylglycinamide formyltransferase [Deltaproteobacteria bacterium]
MHEANGKACPKFAIFASGRGSNATVLMDSFISGFNLGEVCVLVSNHADAPVLERAKERGIATVCIPHKGMPREEHDAAMFVALQEHGAEHLLLAGYMRILGSKFIQEFPGHILNIHPSLLPDFRGLRAIERQWEERVKVAGATVHEVIADVDAGTTLLQGSIEVRGDEGPEGLADRILNEVEHKIYPQAVWLLTRRMDQPSS